MIKDIIQQNENTTPNSKQLAVLKEHFSACFRADGSFDLERFKAAIANDTNIVQEGYELKFLGKSYAKLLASTDSTTVIKPNEAHNSLPENANSQNIYISGDNLDGLKHLLKSYSQSIKCIYIDPPYNTGSDGFVYADNFNYTKENLVEKLSVSEEEAERILELTKRGSASHSAWLMFMYCRLLLAKDLLKDDGVIFISIDDNEQANLKLLCDDVFGEENFTGSLLWQKRKGGGNDSQFFATDHEYIFCYLRDKAKYAFDWKVNYDDEYLKRYKEEDVDGRYYWDTLSRAGLNNPIIYDVECPDGTTIKNGTWQISKKSFDIGLKDGNVKIEKNKNGGWTVFRKVRMPLGKVFRSIITEVTNKNSSDEIYEIFGVKAFDTPKPTDLISKVIRLSQITNEDIVCDFFSGSGTTANAVMQLNANDEGNRKFIAVQLPEVLSSDVDSQKIAYEFLKENNLPTTLDYIGIERIKRAAAKIKQEHPDKDLDLGFKHFILEEPNQNTLDKLENFDKAALITDTSLLDDFGKPTILATWLNADGYGLTTQATAIDLAGYTAYHCQKHLYLIDSGFTLESMKALLGKYDAEGSFNPENIIVFGYSFNQWNITEMLEKNLRILNDGEKNLKINFNVRY